MRILRSLGGFTLTTVVSAAVSLVSIPVVIDRAGAQAWAGVAVGQTIGLLIGVLAGWGWAAIGPTTVAAMSEAERPQYLADATTARLLISVACLPVLILVSVLATPGGSSPLVTGLAALNFLIWGVSASWYFVGCSRPMDLLVYDTLPRSVATLGGMIALLAGAPLVVFVTLQVIGSGAALVAGFWRVSRQERLDLDWRIEPNLRNLRENRHGLVTSLGTHFYMYAPVVLVGAAAPTVLAHYAIADRILKFSASSLAPVTQVAQGYGPHPDPVERARRLRRIERASLAFCLALALGFLVLLPLAARVLSAGHIAISWGSAAGFGVCMGGMMFSSLIGLAGMVVLNREGQLARTVSLGAVLIIPAVVYGARVGGMTGAAISVASVQVLVAATQWVLARRGIRGLLHSTRGSMGRALDLVRS